MSSTIPFSILDLCPIPEGSNAAAALSSSLELARKAEDLGFKRFWLAEHHSMPGIASAATSIVIGYIAGGTKTIRVGSGGIMLPNHSPLVVAEQFGTLASLYPDRIDLGLGRAPGTDPATTQALRREGSGESPAQFPGDVRELQYYFGKARPGQVVRAVPGEGLMVPIWLLGSSLFSAALAAQLGLPFAFASHFAPAAMQEALQVYRSRFQPSESLTKPYVMLAANVIVSETKAQARREFSSLQQAFVNLRRGRPGQVPPPIENIEEFWSPPEKQMVEQALAVSFVGTSAEVKAGLNEMIAALHPDEMIITAHLFSLSARLRSLELLAEVLL